jgi:hypothetical protein
MLGQASLAPEPQAAPVSPPRAQPVVAPRVVAAQGMARRPVGQPPGAAPPLDGVALTRELQRHLRRVGCFHGPVTGAWTPATRAAMKDFTLRMNAMLPVDQPDQVLLAMLQSHADNACAEACPAGHDRGANGRCAPSTVADRADKQIPAAPDRGAARGGLAAPVPPADVSPVLPGRMALAGPKAEDGSALPHDSTDGHAAARRPERPRAWGNDRRRPMGAWLFYDAPVDRLLGR